MRVRPMLQRELGRDEVVYFPSDNTSRLEGIKVADGQHLIESKYDKVYAQRTQQDEIYEFVQGKFLQLLLSVANLSLLAFIDSIYDVSRGFNATIFAYGQTGSGKTYTMFGQHWDDN